MFNNHLEEYNIVNIVMGIVITGGEYCQSLLASSMFGVFIMVLASGE